MKKRSMPSQKKIYEYWQNKFNEKYNKSIFKGCCFACGVDTMRIERCHILPRCQGGGDEISNLHLLCRFCHIESEFFIGKSYDIWIEDKDDSLEIEMRWNKLKHYQKLIEKELYYLVPDEILTKMI